MSDVQATLTGDTILPREAREALNRRQGPRGVEDEDLGVFLPCAYCGSLAKQRALEKPTHRSKLIKYRCWCVCHGKGGSVEVMRAGVFFGDNYWEDDDDD